MLELFFIFQEYFLLAETRSDFRNGGMYDPLIRPK